MDKKENRWLDRLQRFGGAMFTPVLLFIFPGIVVGIAILMTNPMIVGDIAKEGTSWSKFWYIIIEGGWTVFRNMELLFVIGLPLGLVRKARGRAAMEAFVIYLMFNYFLSAVLSLYGPKFGVDMSLEAGGDSGLKMIAGIKTLDTGVLGALFISGVSVWLHNNLFEKELPESIGVFQGSALVTTAAFILMIPLAFTVAFIWPKFQVIIKSMQTFFVRTGNLGVFTYIFLEKALLPTGMHHFIYAPFNYGPAVVEGGTTLYWMENMQHFANSTQSLKTLFPEGGFALYGLSNYFGIPGIALAFYKTAKPENRKKVLSLLIPGVLTAVLSGITEPFDYTYLFTAPILFLVHSILAGLLATAMYMFGVVGDMCMGIIELIAKNWIPMWANHSSVYIRQVIIGVIFIFIYYVVFTYLIEKYDLNTPGRQELILKTSDNKEKNKDIDKNDLSLSYISLLGGKNNIKNITNCATRLRVSVKDIDLVSSDESFVEIGAHGVNRSGNNLQIIIGLSVPKLREEIEFLL